MVAPAERDAFAGRDSRAALYEPGKSSGSGCLKAHYLSSDSYMESLDLG